MTVRKSKTKAPAPRLRSLSGRFMTRSAIPTKEEFEDAQESGELGFRALTIQKDTISEDEAGNMTMKAIITSDTPTPRAVKHRSGVHKFKEILDPQGVNLEREAIIPLLLDHDQSIDNQIGSVRGIHRDGGNLMGEINIVGGARTEHTRQLIKAGHLKTFSAGYTVEAYDPVEPGNNKLLRAADWTMYEVSVVSVPADPVCQIRALGEILEGGSKMTVKGQGKGGGNRQQRRAQESQERRQAPRGQRRSAQQEDALDLEDELQTRDAGQGDDDHDDDDDVDTDDVIDEPQTRGASKANDKALMRRAKSLGLAQDDEFVTRYIGTSTTPAEMTAAFHNTMVEGTRANRQIGLPAEAMGRGLEQRSRENDLLVRAWVATETNALDKLGDEFRGILPASGKLDARSLLRHVAKRHNFALPLDLDMDATQFFQIRAVAPMVLADFANIANLVINRLQLSDQDIVKYWGTGLARDVEFTSFQNGTFTTLPILDALLETAAGSEVKAGGMSLTDTQGKLTTFNRRYPISRQLFTGNGVGLFTNLNQQIRNVGVDAENQLLRRKILENPIMSDKVPFFHGSRGNVATGVSMDVEGLGQIQAASMRESNGGVPYITVIANPVHNLVLKQLSKQTNATRVEDINPFGGDFTAVTIPGFPKDAMLWIADPRIRPAFLRMIMAGQPVPGTKIVESAQYDGFELLAYLDRGVAHGDPRGAFLAFTGDEPDELPNGDEANYEAQPIDEVIG